MTREDAIKIFNTVLLFGKCDCPKEEIEECLKMAIKALEQEPRKGHWIVHPSNKETVRNLLTELIDMIDNGSQRDLDRADEIGTSIIKLFEQEPQTFKWCTDCREYDQEKHCCHRWSKVIRDTVEEMKQEQEPILDKLRARIEMMQKMCDKDDLNLMAQYSSFGMVLDVIDEYKAESENT